MLGSNARWCVDWAAAIYARQLGRLILTLALLASWDGRCFCFSCCIFGRVASVCFYGTVSDGLERINTRYSMALSAQLALLRMPLRTLMILGLHRLYTDQTILCIRGVVPPSYHWHARRLTQSMLAQGKGYEAVPCIHAMEQEASL